MNIYPAYLATSTLFCQYMLPSVILCAMILIHSCIGGASTYSAYFHLRNRKTEYNHNVLHSDCLSSIFNAFFLTILLSRLQMLFTVRVTNKARAKKITIVTIPNQSWEKN